MFLRNLLFIFLILQPFVDKLSKKAGAQINIFNEMLSIAVLIGLVVIYAYRKRANNLILVVLAFIFYCSFLVIWRQIFPLGFFQIIIYSQFFFYFLYFHSLSEEVKHKTLISFKRIMSVFVIVIACLAFFEAYDHTTFRNFLGVHSVKRGINYFYLISFFGSGPSLSIFLFIYILIWHYIHYALKVTIKKLDIAMVVLAAILAILTFSRKEVLFIFLFLIFFPYPTRNQLNKWIKRGVFFFAVFLGLSVYYITFFGVANSTALNPDYVRWKIVSKSFEIYKDHFPLGSGPGTFGSRTSLMMDHIYQRYNIGQDLLGWEAINSRGPIYDAFLFSFITEIGIGIFIFLFFIYKLFEGKTILNSEYSRFTKNFLLFFTLSLSFFVPMFTNNFGFIIMAFLGLMISNISVFKFRRWYAKA